MLALSSLSLTATCLNGPCYPGNEFCAQPFQNAPMYHLMDQHGCGENDPNGPVFDPVHGVFHHFYQIHLAAVPGHGPDYGHFVSKDFISWAPLPVAIWNGFDSSVWPPRETKYDNEAIFTGSALVVDGAGPGGKGKGVVQIYPGLCNKQDWPGCATGTLLAQAVPANYAEDELLTNWSKPSYNPIMENTQRDPSTPWKEPSGEWRMRTYDSMVYAAADDAALLAGQWYTVGKSDTFRKCECPSFYPLPPATPGFEAAYELAQASAGGLPTHVHKTSCGGDWWQLGSYTPGAPKVLGSFNATAGWEDLFVQRRIDFGGFYASKDSLYPTKDSAAMRRINWGWAQVPPASTQTLPREITFNALTRTLEQSPIAELTALRSGPPAIDMGPTILAPGLTLPIPKGVLHASEVLVEFTLPAPGTTSGTIYFGVSVGTQAATFPAHERFPSTPSEAQVPYEDPSRQVADGVVPSDDRAYGLSPVTPPNSPAVACLFQWTPPSASADDRPYYEVPVACGKFADSLRVLKNATTVSLRLYYDATFLEAYFENGRVAITAPVDLMSDEPQLALTSTAPSLMVKKTQVYKMKSIWTTPEAVRQAPRVYDL